MDFKRQIKNELQNIFADKRLYGGKVLVSSVNQVGFILAGSFIDPVNNRVFQFEITKDKTITYKPSITVEDSEDDSAIVRRLDAYSAGFSSVVTVIESNNEEINKTKNDSFKCLEANLYPCNGYCIELRKPCVIRNIDNLNFNNLIDFIFGTARTRDNY